MWTRYLKSRNKTRKTGVRDGDLSRFSFQYFYSTYCTLLVFFHIRILNWTCFMAIISKGQQRMKSLTVCPVSCTPASSKKRKSGNRFGRPKPSNGKRPHEMTHGNKNARRRPEWNCSLTPTWHKILQTAFFGSPVSLLVWNPSQTIFTRDKKKYLCDCDKCQTYPSGCK